MTDPALQPAVVEYEDGRAGRQLGAFAAMGLIMAGLLALGIWMIVASNQQYPWQTGALVGTGFGLFFALLGLAVTVTAVEVLGRIRRLSSQTMLVADATGVTLAAGTIVPWSQIERIEAVTSAPAPRRTNRLPQLDPGHRLGLAVKGGLDAWVGVPFGVRDGRRSVRLVLRDGTDRAVDLTLPVGPRRFEAVATALGEHAAHNGVWFSGPR